MFPANLSKFLNGSLCAKPETLMLSFGGGGGGVVIDDQKRELIISSQSAKD